MNNKIILMMYKIASMASVIIYVFGIMLTFASFQQVQNQYFLHGVLLTTIGMSIYLSTRCVRIKNNNVNNSSNNIARENIVSNQVELKTKCQHCDSIINIDATVCPICGKKQ